MRCTMLTRYTMILCEHEEALSWVNLRDALRSARVKCEMQPNLRLQAKGEASTNCLSGRPSFQRDKDP